MRRVYSDVAGGVDRIVAYADKSVSSSSNKNCTATERHETHPGMRAGCRRRCDADATGSSRDAGGTVKQRIRP